MWMLLLGPVIVAALTLLEWRWPARRDAAQRRLNLAAWPVWLTPIILVVPLIAVGAMAAADRLGLPSLPIAGWPVWLKVAAYVLAADFGEFAFHRAQHAIPFLWRMHSLHHSDPCMNATTTARHWWGDAIIKALTVWPLVAIAFRPEPIALATYAVMANWNYFSHANLNVNFGRLSWVLISPAFHRVHHSAEPGDFDTNFAGLFPIFDVLAGTYRRPRHCPTTGLEHRPHTVSDVVLWPLRTDRLRAEAAGTAPAAE